MLSKFDFDSREADALEVLRRDAFFTEVFLRDRAMLQFGPYIYSGNFETVGSVLKKRIRSIAVFSVNYERPIVNVIIKDQRSSLSDKISSIGGTLGLFTGFSILSIIEMVYWACKAAIPTGGKFCRGKNDCT